ncbi:GNAT family N-acetyltransferase [Rhodobacteraceae bacterium MCCB 386]|nr:GNAT family N-acetyltransferase [Roseitranquillus sediminis]
METPVLETERLILRAPRSADYPTWNAFIRDERSRFVGGPLSEGRAWRAFATLVGHWLIRGCGGFVLVERETGEPVGHVGPWFPGEWPEREIAWCAWTPSAEGRGLIREAAKVVLTHVFRDLGWSTAVSYIDADNARSIALAERLGAVRDPDAVVPPDIDVLVFRHPRPEAA